MSPPPAEAMLAVPGLPSFAIAHITALPRDHEDKISFPNAYIGGGETWCEKPDNTDCYRRIDTCIAGTEDCFRELARCTPRKIPDSTGPWCDDDTIDQILEQSGDPSYWYHWAKFAGLSMNYVVLYMDGNAPAGSGRKYIENATELDRSQSPARVFGKDDPIKAGYYLIHMRALNEMDTAASEACFERIDRNYTSEYNRQHGTRFERVREATGLPLADAGFRALLTKIQLATYDEGCQVIGAEYKRVDPQREPITVTLGARDITMTL
jgi:hypothetical protein